MDKKTIYKRIAFCAYAVIALSAILCIAFYALPFLSATLVSDAPKIYSGYQMFSAFNDDKGGYNIFLTLSVVFSVLALIFAVLRSRFKPFNSMTGGVILTASAFGVFLFSLLAYVSLNGVINPSVDIGAGALVQLIFAGVVLAAAIVQLVFNDLLKGSLRTLNGSECEPVSLFHPKSGGTVKLSAATATGVSGGGAYSGETVSEELQQAGNQETGNPAKTEEK